MTRQAQFGGQWSRIEARHRSLSLVEQSAIPARTKIFRHEVDRDRTVAICQTLRQSRRRQCRKAFKHFSISKRYRRSLLERRKSLLRPTRAPSWHACQAKSTSPAHLYFHLQRPMKRTLTLHQDLRQSSTSSLLSRILYQCERLHHLQWYMRRAAFLHLSTSLAKLARLVHELSPLRACSKMRLLCAV